MYDLSTPAFICSHLIFDFGVQNLMVEVQMFLFVFVQIVASISVSICDHKILVDDTAVVWI
jgi:hypothetical protein